MIDIENNPSTLTAKYSFYGVKIMKNGLRGAVKRVSEILNYGTWISRDFEEALLLNELTRQKKYPMVRNGNNYEIEGRILPID